MRVLSGACLFDKAATSESLDRDAFRFVIAETWGVRADMVVFYADRVFMLPGVPFVEWRVFESPSRLFVDWLIYDLKEKPGANEKVSEILGFLTSRYKPTRMLFDDNDVPLH